VIACDVNVLVYAFRADMPDHDHYARWLTAQVNSDEAFGVSPLALSGFVRVVTNPRVFRGRPSTVAKALAFCEQLLGLPHAVLLREGARHWDIFSALCTETPIKGNLVPAAYFAALAIESGCEWITTDGDFARFPGLRWRHPLK